MAEERYDFDLDVHIIPVGINYTGAEKFKKWQLINFGEPILLKKYSNEYKTNPALAINHLKDEIEQGMQVVTTHVSHGPIHEEMVELSEFYARHDVLSAGNKFEPITWFKAKKEITPKLEKLKNENPEALKNIVQDYNAYKAERNHYNFRENTFDKARQSGLAITFMALYFILLFPLFIYGLVINYLPYRIPQWYAENNLKQKIFWSSAKYAISCILFPVYYLILTLIVWSVLGSLLSALIFLVSFPIAGNLAFYYWFDFKKWWSIIRYKQLGAEVRGKLSYAREKLLNTLAEL